MYNLLVVDDEEIAVRGIVQGIDWSDFPLNHIFEANDAEEARQIIKDNPVHILLSDIDMPNDNGIQLLEWVREISPLTEAIFLTGHADFKFAQQALQLDSFDYLLKPVDHNLLKERIMAALDKIKHNEEMDRFHKTYEHYYQQWNNQLPILRERFWQDLLRQRIVTDAENLKQRFVQYGIPLTVEQPVQGVLISIEQWREPLNTRDEEIMTYAVKNAAEEIVLNNLDGQIIQDSGGIIAAIIYNPPEDSSGRLQENCRLFIDQCQLYFHCSLSCYIGKAVLIPQLRDAIQSLMDMERNNVTLSNSVLLQQEYRKLASAVAGKPVFDDWAVLLEMGKRNEWILRIGESFARMEEEKVDHQYLESFYYGFVHMLDSSFQRMAVRIGEVYPHGEWREFLQASKSIARMKAWTVQMADTACAYLAGHRKEVSFVINKVMQYIEEHLGDDFSRDDIAGSVYLNPAYLSRLFRKETGNSLSDYILDARVNRVKPMLEKTNIKISDIAQSVGYDNFSHFTRMFKKATGVTPQEYRRKYQDI